MIRKRFIVGAALILLNILFAVYSSLFAQQVRGMVRSIPPIPELSDTEIGYTQSWALVIGIDRYQDYPQLKTAVSGAKAFAQKLREDFGFPADHIIELYNEQATKEKIESYLKDFLFSKTKKDDRLIIYFGGHGDTFNGEVGYLCPYDAQKNRLPFTGISMSDLRELNKILAAKHILYIFDCCFSGLALVRGGIGDLPPTEKDYYKKLLTKKTRQILTAGQSNELAYDYGPGGKYSPFTYFLLEGMDSKSVLDEYNIIQITRLGQYVKDHVGRYTGGKQTPIIDRFPESEQGDMLLWKDVGHPIVMPTMYFQFANGARTELDRLIKHWNKKYNKQNFLIVFWDRYCIPCQHEIKALNSMPFPENFLIITINLDDPDNTKDFTWSKNFINGYQNPNFINLFLLSNAQKMELLQKLKFKGTPLTLLVDSKRTIRLWRLGYDYQSQIARMIFRSTILEKAIK